MTSAAPPAGWPRRPPRPGFVTPLLYAVFAVLGGHRSYISSTLLLVCVLDRPPAVLVRPVMRVLGPCLASTSTSGELEPVRGAV